MRLVSRSATCKVGGRKNVKCYAHDTGRDSAASKELQ